MKKLLVLFAIIAFVGVGVPAMAADWNFYGDARLFTFYVSDDAEESGFRGLTTSDNKDAELQWDMQGQSRIGARVKADAVSGHFEFGLNSFGNSDVDVRDKRIYGVWDFGPGKFKVGKDYTPINQFISGQVFDGDLGLLGIGTTYGGRPAQAALSFGGFEIAFIDPNVSQLVSPENDALSGGDVDKVFPKVEASYGMGFDTWNFGLQGGYQYYQIEDVESLVDGSTDDIGVTSWLLGANVGFNFGPAYVNASGSYGQNVGNAGWNIPGFKTASGGFGTWDGDDDIDKNNSWMAALVLGLKVSEMLTLEAGGGYRSDDPKDAPDGLDEKQNAYAIYGQAVVAMAPGVYVIPEVGYYDYGKDFTDNDAGNQFYAGAKWQINF